MGLFGKKKTIDEMGKVLPCGCYIGQIWCKAAADLYAEKERIYKRLQTGESTWAEYEAAHRAYQAHYAGYISS